MSDYSNSMINPATCEPINRVVRDVNMIFGWAIYHLRWRKIKELEDVVEESEKE